MLHIAAWLCIRALLQYFGVRVVGLCSLYGWPVNKSKAHRV